MSRTPSDLHLLRLVPGTTVVHRLWAGTKLVALAAITVTLSISPTWPALAIVGPLVIAAVAVARIPGGATPRLPRWFVAGLAITAGLAFLAGGDPTVHVGGAAIGLGGLSQWARATSIAVVIITGAMLLGWTTPFSEIAPALRRLGSPVRRLGVPVDEWAITAALALRCLPLLLDEIRTILAARRLRARPHDGRHPVRQGAAEAFGLIRTVLTVSTRRAREMGDAIDARGGWQPGPAARVHLGLADVVALSLVVVAAAAAILVGR
jgi:energy-coupling factor transport system permease protein